MATLMTNVDIPLYPIKLDYGNSIFFIGSCFADSIGNRMKEMKFDVCVNPFGVVYNPVSIASELQLLLEKEYFTENDLDFENELWFSFSHYTLFSDTDKQRCLDKINESFITAKSFLSKADVLIITLGTSWVYELKSNHKVVSNCHKLPSARFNRYFSTTQNSTDNLKKVILSIQKLNPKINFIFTLSPVRHWKDGAIGNQRSKAALSLSIAELEQTLEKVYYFPSYEIFMDELRDYRFYASDMLHPTDLSTDYVWQKFTNTLLTDRCAKFMHNVEQIIQSIKHKPRHANTSSYQKFITSIIHKIEEISIINPSINFQNELHELKRCLSKE